MGMYAVPNHIKAVVEVQFSDNPRSWPSLVFQFDLICYIEALLATFSEGCTADTKFSKANCCLDWGNISFIHSCNLSTWVVLSCLSPKHHVICLDLILTSSNFLMWRMCSEGKSVYSSLIDQFHFCSHLPVLLTLFLRKNNYMESGFSRGLFCFMWGTDKDLSHQKTKIRWEKSVPSLQQINQVLPPYKNIQQCHACGH